MLEKRQQAAVLKNQKYIPIQGRLNILSNSSVQAGSGKIFLRTKSAIQLEAWKPREEVFACAELSLSSSKYQTSRWSPRRGYRRKQLSMEGCQSDGSKFNSWVWFGFVMALVTSCVR